MLEASIRSILTSYGIDSGSLVFDDKGKKITKKTTRIAGANKINEPRLNSLVLPENYTFSADLHHSLAKLRNGPTIILYNDFLRVI